MRGIADTGFLVAYANRRDVYFPWAYALAEHILEPLLTCESVLAETAYHLKNSGLVLRLIETGLVRVAFDLESHRRELAELARRYADRQPDLADLCPPHFIRPHGRRNGAAHDRARSTNHP